ncbi:MAG TPA: hypothetical protein VM285_14700 [Polyangia bacterium]|nr:hypothetical protein [Polyangia bacterium]
MRIAVSFPVPLHLGLGLVSAVLLAPALTAADEPKPEPLDSVGDYTWSENVGLMRQTGDENTDGAAGDVSTQGGMEAAVPEELASMQVPSVAATDVGYCTEMALLLAAARAGEVWGPLGTLRLRCEPRHVASLLTGWGHLDLGLGGFPGEQTMLVRGDFRMGMDVHVLRLPWVGFGPFVGYRVDGFILFEDDQDNFVGHGLELGGHAIFRTPESPGTPPLFFADLGVGQRFDFPNDGSGTVFEAMLGIGGQLRFLAFVDVELAGEILVDLVTGIGMGGYY